MRALRAGCTVELRARGGSMWPLLRTGDWLSVEPAAPSALRRDDIAVIATAHGLVAHRVVSTAPLVTRGDRLRAPDLPPAAGAVVGRVRAVRRCGVAVALDGRLGRALGRAARPLGRLAARLFG